jgi:Gas vesicle synthesis protein GvpL/GvpF
MQPGCYLYGLIQASDELEFGPIGLEYDGQPAPVHTLRVGNIAAVISPHARCRRVMPRRKNLAPHNQVLGEVMKTTTIVPMTFGHVADSEDAVRTVLERHEPAIRAELARVEGCVEMSVMMRWDLENIFVHLVENDPQLRSMRDELFAHGRQPSHDERFRLGQLFEQQHKRERARLRARLVEALEPVARMQKDETPREMEQVAKLALLVGRDEVKHLGEHVERVAAVLGSAYAFEVAGPWAPFSFVGLSLSEA